MDENINKFLEDLLKCSAVNAGQPYVPQLPEQDPDGSAGAGLKFYQEIDIHLENIAGTSLAFGTVEKHIIDGDGNVTKIHQKQGHILGSGILVTNLNPTVKDGIHLPGVAGVCHFCKQECMKLLEADAISLEEAQRRALFDTDSAARCEECGRRDLCIRHCRPFEKADGTKLSLCPDCRKAAQREKWVAVALNALLSPIIDEKLLLADQGKTKSENEHSQI